ncbi:MAG TPA: dihydrodipicolinate reductase C-terminal domain-containing protein [Candidatus Acidoferrum sp.]|nr:dihydrodipicolinate reductase C-terminal domain-containing protein [Candidatus Acidoferrum sp.]
MNRGLAIVGCGKMGRLIEQFAAEYGFEVRTRLTRERHLHDGAITRESLQGVEVAVEFTDPDAAPDNLRRLASLGINTVCGTTGWFEQLPAIHESVLAAGTALVYSSNFSVGVNVFLQTVARAASFFAKYPEYEAWGWEIHHSAKKDAPSGTLKKLAEEIRASGYDRALTLTANRAGSHAGTHEIGFDSAADTITLRHTARSREGFARGALRAARWIAGKKGVFEFREILGELS